MATIFLSQGDSFTQSNSDDTFIGAPGGSETLLIENGATNNQTDANIEEVHSPLPLNAHSFQVTNNGLEIMANGSTILTIPSLNQPLNLLTGDGNVEVTQTGAQEFTFTNPNDANDTATVGTTASIPQVGLGNEISDTFEESPGDGEKLQLTENADRADLGDDNATGTANADTFDAPITTVDFVNGNTLNSGDVLDGKGGQDTLDAELTNSALTGGFPAATVRPTSESVEDVQINALTDITLEASDMRDVDRIGSYESNGDLKIENLTTLTSEGQARNTDAITIRMDHTSNVNTSENAESDLEVLFDENYLLSGESSDTDILELRFVNNLSLAQDNRPVDQIEEIQFSVDGQTISVDVTSIGENQSLTGEDGYDALAQAIRDELSAQGINTVTVEVQQPRDSVFSDDIEGFQQGDVAGQFNPIELRSSESTLGTGPINRDAAQVNFDGLNTWRVDEEVGEDEPVATNIELEKVGRGSDGGDLVVGGKSQVGQGIPVFNVEVFGGNDLPNNLASMTSTNDALDQVIIESNGNNDLTPQDELEDGENAYANLKIGNSVTPDAGPFGGSGLSLIDASEFNGDLTLGTSSHRVENAETLDATGGGDVTFWSNISSDASYAYNSAGGNDTFDVSYDVGAMDTAGSAIGITTEGGSDVVSLMTGSSTSSDFVNHLNLENVEVSTGSGEDSITVGDNRSFSDVDAGSGADYVQVSKDTGPEGVDRTAAWLFNAEDAGTTSGIVGNGNGEYNAFNISLQVEFQDDVVSDVVEIDSQDFTTEAADINDAIQQAIENDEALSELLRVSEVENEGLRIDATQHRALAPSDLNVKFLAPTFENDDPQSNQPDFTSDTAEQFAGRQEVTQSQLEDAFETWFPGTEGITSGSTSDSGTGIYSGTTDDAGEVHDELFAAVDHTANNMADADSTAGNGEFEEPSLFEKEQLETGANSTEDTFNVINGGTENDVIVLSSNTAPSSGFDTVEFEGNFGTDTILNFETGPSEEFPSTGTGDQLDFTSYLDEDADERGDSATPNNDNRVDQEVPFTSENGLATSLDGDIDHNANIIAGLSANGVFSDFETDKADNPTRFSEITANQVENALAANQSWVAQPSEGTGGSTEDAEMVGSEFVFRVAEDQKIQTDADGDGQLGLSVDPLKEKVFSVEIADFDANGEGNYSFEVTERGTIDYGQMFSDLSNVSAANASGTAAAATAEANAKAAIGGGTDPTPTPNQPPVFQSGGGFTVAEDASAGTNVFDLGAVSSDTDGTVENFSLTSGNTDGDGDGQSAFSVDSSTGQLTVNDPDDLNDTGTNEFTLGVQITDDDGATANGTVSADVTSLGGGGANESPTGDTQQALSGATSPFDASTASFDFSFDGNNAGSTESPFEINTFGGANNNDHLELTNADSVSFSSTTNDIEIDVASGNATQNITLVGVNDGSAVFDEPSAESVLGYDAFTVA